MNEQRYMISDASKKLGVETHVLRYWEEELEMDIPRNEMGHRYYTESNLKVLKSVKELKNQGFQLKAIKLLMPDLVSSNGQNMDKLLELKDEMNKRAEAQDQEKAVEKSILKTQTFTITPAEEAEVTTNHKDKMVQLQLLMNKIISNALCESQKAFGQAISHEVANRVVKEMDYLMRVNQEQEEARFKRLDETIRGMQQKAKLEAAAAMETRQLKKRRKRGLFHRG